MPRLGNGGGDIAETGDPAPLWGEMLEDPELVYWWDGGLVRPCKPPLMLKLDRRLWWLMGWLLLLWFVGNGMAPACWFCKCLRKSPSYPLVKPPQGAYGVL